MMAFACGKHWLFNICMYMHSKVIIWPLVQDETPRQSEAGEQLEKMDGGSRKYHHLAFIEWLWNYFNSQPNVLLTKHVA